MRQRRLRDAPAWLVWLNLWVIYLVWGSTYLAIRVAVETLPPFTSGGIRFGLAGLVVLGFLALRGGPERLRIGRRAVVGCAIVGTLLLLLGNGLVMAAERTVPSGLAALVIGGVPLWVVLLRLAHGERPSRWAIVGTIVGIVGVALLVLPRGGSGGVELAGLVMLIVAAASWAVGTYYSRRLPLPADPFVSTGYQMLLGGMALVAAGIVVGEPAAFDAAAVSFRSVLAMAYLWIFGSLLAFTSYTWLLQHAPVSRVSTYAYVNPVVAVALGWLVLGEEITLALLAPAAIIVAGVAFIVRSETPREQRETVAEAAPVPAAGGAQR
ncbi:MAG TPA: EamA family transporter [Candidatus Limnocylindrales bacterium]|nr:EamA family transporter [Candidatus Limnocylindrales bacterium]